MRLLTKFFALLVVLMATGSLALAQSSEPATSASASPSASASKAEVDALRSELAAQRQVIEQLKAIGLQISQIRKQERLVIARVPLDKLTDLAKLQQIKFISEPRR